MNGVLIYRCQRCGNEVPMPREHEPPLSCLDCGADAWASAERITTDNEFAWENGRVVRA